MNTGIEAVFNQSPDIGSFQDTIESLNGEFSFAAEDMIAMGEAYFKRFPDSHHDRNMEEVHYGYKIIRICIIEKIVNDFTGNKIALFRKLFDSIQDAQEVINWLKDHLQSEEIDLDYKKLVVLLDNIKRIIDEIPRSMIKERYVGGITYLYNILYFFKTSLGLPRT